MPGSRRRYVIAGLLAIILVYTLYYMTFVYVGHFNDIPRKIRHTGRLVSILIVYGVGFYAFKKYDVKWISAIWNFIYFTVIVVLLLIGLYDWSFGPASPQTRNIAKTLHEFLISPILYVGILILNRILIKMSPES
jgi:hypothetical protein